MSLIKYFIQLRYTPQHVSTERDVIISTKYRKTQLIRAHICKLSGTVRSLSHCITTSVAPFRVTART